MKKITSAIARRIQYGMAAFAGVIMTLLLNSCGSAPDAEKMLETIPADAFFVVRVDAGKIIDNAGIELKDDKYVLSDDLDKLYDQLPSDGRDAVDAILKGLPALDVKTFMVYMYDKERVIATCGLEHEKEAKLALEKELGKPSSEDGFDVFDNDGVVIAIKDNQVWLSDKLKYITKALDMAKEKNFTANEAASAYLMGEHAIAFTANIASVYDFAISEGGRSAEQQLETFKEYKDSYICMAVDLDGATIKYTCSAIDNTGKAVAPFQATEMINTDFLGYVPGNAIAVAAMGAPTSQVLDQINKTTNYRNQEFAKYIDGINGTIAFAVVPPASIGEMFRTENWGFTLMAHMPSYLSTDIMNMIVAQFNDPYYYTIVAEGDQYHVTSRYRTLFDSYNIYFGTFNDYLIISNRRISGGQSGTSLAKIFEGQRMEAYAALSKDNSLVAPLNLPFGAEAKFIGDSSESSLSLSLTGTSKKFIEAIISLAADQRLQRNIIEAVNSYSRQSYQDDYYNYGDSMIAEVEIVDDDYYYGEPVAPAEEYYY